MMRVVRRDRQETTRKIRKMVIGEDQGYLKSSKRE
jgi:hypothetical protein